MKMFKRPGLWLLGSAAALGAVGYLYRMWAGLSATTHLNDQFPWGLWVSVNIEGGVPLAAGGFTVAALVEIFGGHGYRPLLRPALLTSLLGYTFVILGLLPDLGRYYNLWHPALPWYWQERSVLLEVGLCVMLYLSVLYLEFVPVAAERMAGRFPALAGFLSRAVRGLMKPLVIMGVVLSCLHQSSLGTLMLIAEGKLHPLWYTPALPILFLLSAVAVGFPVVVIAVILTSKSLHRPVEAALLGRLTRMTPILLILYLALKLGDLTLRGAWPLFASDTAHGLLFSLELLMGAVIPAVLFSLPRFRRSAGGLMTASAFAVAGLVLNRLNVFWFGFRPLYAEGIYVPSFWETVISIGLLSGLVLSYRAVTAFFPILSAASGSAKK